MGLKIGLRNEFPRGWWRSASWWLAVLREVGLGIVTVVATAALLPGPPRPAPHLWQRPTCEHAAKRRSYSFAAEEKQAFQQF